MRDLEQLWYDRDLWPRIFAQPTRWDEMIDEFNAETGVLAGPERSSWRYLITGATLIDGSRQRSGSLRTEGERIAEVVPADR